MLVLFFVETSSPHANFCLSATIKGKTQSVLMERWAPTNQEEIKCQENESSNVSKRAGPWEKASRELFVQLGSFHTVHALRPDCAHHETESTLSFILLQRMLQ
jgi:hypothetical protein